MNEKVTRIYGTQAQAMGAYNELKNLGYEDLAMVSRPASRQGATTGSRDEIVSELMRAHILESHAEIYAERIVQGATLVTVDAVFGTALKATQVMDGFDPVDSGIGAPKYKTPLWDEAHPFSSALQLPLLSSTRLPFEAMWGIPSVLTGRNFFSGVPLTLPGGTPFSSMLGLPTLMSKATPFSSMFGLPLLR